MNQKSNLPELSRRHFLKTSACLTLGSVAGGPSLIAALEGRITSFVLSAPSYDFPAIRGKLT